MPFHVDDLIDLFFYFVPPVRAPLRVPNLFEFQEVDVRAPLGSEVCDLVISMVDDGTPVFVFGYRLIRATVDDSGAVTATFEKGMRS